MPSKRGPLGGVGGAIVAAVAIPLIWTAAGLLGPPGMFSDPSAGFMTWRGFLAGAPFDHALLPDPSNIATDVAQSFGWWSPGQYLLPGLVTLAGLRLGTAIVLVVGAATVVGLLGWIRLARHFGFDAKVALAVVLVIATARYSTLDFRKYIGGEPLILAATPWMMLWSCRIPASGALEAAALAALVVVVGFLAKLSGLIVAGGALIAGSAVVLYTRRGITAGMIGGAAGALAALVLLDALWFSHQVNVHYANRHVPFEIVNFVYALTAPFAAGVSVHEMLNWLLQRPSHQLLGTDAIVLWLIAPFGVAAAALLASQHRKIASDPAYVVFAAVFFLVFLAAMAFLYRRMEIPPEERHYRPLGVLLLIGFVALAANKEVARPLRAVIVAVCVLASVYGIASFVVRPASERAAAVDPYSRTRLYLVGADAMGALREAYGRHGRDALFVLPSCTLAVALPAEARVMCQELDFVPGSILAAARYRGRVKGPLYVVIQSALADSPKRDLLLHAFADYDQTAWQERRLPQASVFEQAGAVK